MRAFARYKKYSERVRSSPTGRVCRIYGGRARHLVKTTLMPCCPSREGEHERLLPESRETRPTRSTRVQNPRHCPPGIDIRGLTEYKCAKPQLMEGNRNRLVYQYIRANTKSTISPAVTRISRVELSGRLSNKKIINSQFFNLEFISFEKKRQRKRRSSITKKGGFSTEVSAQVAVSRITYVESRIVRRII